MKASFFLPIAFSLLVSLPAHARTYFSLEGSLAWQSRNDQRIPGATGTGFSIADFEPGPLPALRLYVGHVWNERHELRALYAPLRIDFSGAFRRNVRFQNTTFAPGVATSGTYKFNSYRLTYAYRFPSSGSWGFAAGFTAKVRDAEVSLAQGALRESKSNVGFVPLLSVQASKSIADAWRFRLDLDGLAAPQGRAFDLALFLEHEIGWKNLNVFGGYRMVEGGADNDEVFNFAWIHYATLGLGGEF